MHLSVKTSHALDEADAPVNPEQTPADILVLSFTDSDLACFAAAYNGQGPSLRLTTLARLKHPMSVDLYIEQVAQHARVVLVRLIGGLEWWRYGAEELARIARKKQIQLIMVSGDGRKDGRLTELSTVSPEIVASVDACLEQGGAANARRVLACLQNMAAGQDTAIPEAEMIPNAMLYKTESHHNAAMVTVIFYRAHVLAADTAPIDALMKALTEQDLSVRAFMLTSLKDPAALAILRAEMTAHKPDIIIDATAFSAGEGMHPLAELGAPILQVAMANCSRAAWENSVRGLNATDLAMHVVLPEADGRIFTRAISFKAESEKNSQLEFTRVYHQPDDTRIGYIAKLAQAWVTLNQKTNADKKLALVLSDYPDRAGRSAFAVGLDAPGSAVEILHLLKEQGYEVSDIPQNGTQLLKDLQATQSYSLEHYNARFRQLASSKSQQLLDAWGKPEDDTFFKDGAFHLPCLMLGNMVVALQPDRGSRTDKKSGYHDAASPPRHGYLAFYWWLRDVMHIDALVHIGTHGNLEWLPGKSVVLSEQCWPEIALGAVPVIYPYIVSDPGEAAQAKRRISAVTISHMTPPLKPVALSPELVELETLVDEFSGADGLDARRMKLLREEILHRARRTGLAGKDDSELLTSLEAHLCDIKEQRVGEGLHVFGANAPLEKENLLAALNGKFIAPGPGGSPARGRMDVLPTGRNMVTLDPRMIPTQTATAIGKRAAAEFIRRYVQDHGDYPKNVMIDVWGSASLRNGGDEIAQAMYLMGVQPTWDAHSQRISGFEVLPDDELEWPRVDVSLRISGLFRDMFANLITLFDDAVCAVHGGRVWRIFGNAPAAYGSGVNTLIDSGNWANRSELGQAYLDASQFVYGRDTDGSSERAALHERITKTDALIHMQDQREMDVLSGADFADAEGGFAAAAHALGAEPALYHLDSSQPQKIKARTLAEEISLTLYARALNPEWIAGQMRHGYAGAAAFADVVDQLFAFAATADAVPSAQFDAAFDAYLHDEKVRTFMARENPQALAAMLARFEEAIKRRLWTPLRNSVWQHLRDKELAA